MDHKNRQGKKRVKKRQRGIWGGRRDCGRMEGTKDPGWDEAMEKEEERGKKKGMSELFSNILLNHLKLKKNVRSLLINNTWICQPRDCSSCTKLSVWYYSLVSLTDLSSFHSLSTFRHQNILIKAYTLKYSSCLEDENWLLIMNICTNVQLDWDLKDLEDS